MMHAATWIAPDDATDRANLLGAANVAAERVARTVTVVVEDAGELDPALDAGRRAGLLVVPSMNQVGLGPSDAIALVARARDEGWRLLLLDLGADSAGKSPELLARHLQRVAAFERPVPDVPVAPPHLRRRVGARGAEQFSRAGLLHVDCYSDALATAGVDLVTARTVLDWGAGPGRMTAHLVHQAPDAQITAVDTDAEAISWLAANIGVHAAHAIPVTPPTALEDDAFDVVLGHSVFSHLDVEAQDRWLAELARVTRPGGAVAVSVNGAMALTWHLEHPLVDVPAAVASAVRTDGIAIWTEDGWEEEFYPGYHTTFHAHEYVREHWSRWFDVVAIEAEAATPGQDIVVLRSREAAARTPR